MILAAVCLFVLGYTYVGYPILIALLARLRPLPVRRDPSYQPTVSVCIAVFNGARFIDPKLESLLAQDWPADKLEVLVYDDGSIDDTAARVRAVAARHPNVRLLEGPGRSGKPTGLNQLSQAATGEVLLITDVRQPLSPGSIRALLERLGDPNAGCVSGNLVLLGQAGSGAYWRYEKFIRKNEALFRSLIGVSGSIVALRKVDLDPLPSDLVLDDVWIPMRLRLRGRRILFAEDAQAFDQAFEDEREFGRKVRTLAGNYQLLARMPRLLVPFANPSWFETLSHRVLRLLCPWALIGLLAATVWLVATAWVFPQPPAVRVATGWGLLAGQAGFYLAALAGRRLGRIGGLARTFVVLNAAALVGLWRFLSGAQRITW